jgi:hypothetical protein
MPESGSLREATRKAPNDDGIDLHHGVMWLLPDIHNQFSVDPFRAGHAVRGGQVPLKSSCPAAF